MGDAHRRREEAVDRQLARAQHRQERSTSTMNASGITSFHLSSADEREVPVIPAGEFEALGTIGAATFARHKASGTEYRLSGELAPYEFANAPKAGEIRVASRELRTDHRGQKNVETIYRRGLPTGDGLFARLAARHANRGKARVRPARLVDALAVPILAERKPEHFTLGEAPAPVQSRDAAGNVEYVDLSPLSGATTVVATKAREAIRGQAIIRWLGRQHVTLALVGNRLVASAPNGTVPDSIAEVLRRAEHLIVGWLTGHPVPCARAHGKGPAPDAITVAWPSLTPVCDACLSGEVAK